MYDVLIVDDEALMRQYAAAFIPWAELGFSVAGEAANGKEALAFLEDRSVDVVLTDIRMPVTDGLALARAVASRPKRPKVILYTAYGEFSYAREAINAGVTGYVLKSDDTETLVEYFKQIRQMLDEETSAEEGAAADRTLSQIVRMACAYIDRHYGEELTLTKVANAVNVHPVHLARCFQQQLGRTYLEELTATRMEAAKKLLTAGNSKVYEVGLAVGYKKPAYFAEQFRKYTGVSPHDYKNGGEPKA